MGKQFYIAVKFERGAGYFWSLWKSEGVPDKADVPWECGFADDPKSAIRAARSVETVRNARITLLHPSWARATHQIFFQNRAISGRCPLVAQDEPYFDLRYAQLLRDAARIKKRHERSRGSSGRQTEPRWTAPAHPAPPVVPFWSSVLAVRFPCTLAAAKSAFFAMVKKVHPDVVGGSATAFISVKAAYDAACRDLAGVAMVV